MTQYTNKVERILKDFEYLEQGDKLSCLEACNGRMAYYYNHGGKRVVFHADSEYEGKKYKKGDVLVVPPTDSEYIRLNSIYNDHKEYAWLNKLKKGYKKVCSMLKF